MKRELCVEPVDPSGRQQPQGDRLVRVAAGLGLAGALSACGGPISVVGLPALLEVAKGVTTVDASRRPIPSLRMVMTRTGSAPMEKTGDANGFALFVASDEDGKGGANAFHGFSLTITDVDGEVNGSYATKTVASLDENDLTVTMD